MDLNNKSNQLFVSGFEKNHLSPTQQQDTLFTITWQLHTFTNNSDIKLVDPEIAQDVFLWLVSEACQISMSV